MGEYLLGLLGTRYFVLQILNRLLFVEKNHLGYRLQETNEIYLE